MYTIPVQVVMRVAFGPGEPIRNVNVTHVFSLLRNAVTSTNKTP